MPRRTITTIATFGVLAIIATSAILAVRTVNLSGTSAVSLSSSSISTSSNSSSSHIELTNQTTQVSSAIITAASNSTSTSYQNLTTISYSFSTTSNTTVPIPLKFGNVFGPVPLVRTVNSIGAAEYGYEEFETARLLTNQSGADLNCPSDGPGGGVLGINFQDMNTICYEVNSTGYQESSLDEVILNLTQLSPSSYKFAVTTIGVAFPPDNYNWTFGDGTSGTSKAGDWIAHDYASAGSYNVSLVIVVSATSQNGLRWMLISDYTIMITVTGAIATSITSTNETSNVSSITMEHS